MPSEDTNKKLNWFQKQYYEFRVQRTMGKLAESLHELNEKGINTKNHADYKPYKTCANIASQRNKNSKNFNYKGYEDKEFNEIHFDEPTATNFFETEKNILFQQVNLSIN